MSLGSVVFFEHQIVTSPFEKNFHQVRCVRVVIDNQNAPFSFLPNRRLNGARKNSVDSRGRKSASITLFIPFRSRPGWLPRSSTM